MILKSFIILTLVLSTHCETNFFLADLSISRLIHSYKCVTNTSFALSWNDETLENDLKQASNYIPALPVTAFDSNIDDDPTTRKLFLKPPWSLQQSLNSKTNQLIFDRRWEDMAVVTTEASNGDNIYHPIVSNLENDFEIPLSIRTESEAHLFLCDGLHPSNANCYWFMLQAFSGARSAIRKCARRYIPFVSREYPAKPCQNLLKSVDHPDFPVYLSKQYWSHFKVSKNRNLLSFSKFDGNDNGMKILELRDNDSVIDVRHMIVHSKKLNTLWKIHQTTFIYTDRETDRIKLGPVLDSTENTICISMFVSMCKNCKLKLSLTENEKIIKEEIYETENIKWIEIKFLVENVNGKSFSLLVSTVGTSSGRFWAIDKVRQCQKHEYRVIGFDGYDASISCQLMDADKNVISNTKNFNTPADNKCNEDTIGDFCVPCRWIYKTSCKRIVTCSKNHKSTQATCTCSAGFQNYNSCFFECNSGFYGHGCRKRCGQCYNNECNPIDGTCLSCTSGYTGTKCDVPPTVTLKNAPKITSFDYAEATVQVTNFEVNNLLNNGTPLFYSIEYMVEDNTQDWFGVDIIQKFNDTKPIKIKNLKPDTLYSVRAVVIIKDKNITYHNDAIPASKFTTRCQGIGTSDVYLEPSNTTVNISLKSGLTNVTCKLNKYTLTLTDGVYPMLANQNYILFEKLTPSTNYTLVIQRGITTFKKVFQTSEGVPQSVQNLAIIDVSASTVQLQWRKPSMVYGKLQYYMVEYTHVAFRGCQTQPFKSNDKKFLKTSTVSVTLVGLIPFSQYSVSVFAANSRFQGEKRTIKFNTNHSETIQHEEIPVVKTVSESESVTINLLQVNCTKIRGPISVFANLTCANPWCINHAITTFIQNFSVIYNLYPFSDYTLTLGFCRNSTICNRFTKSRKFKTKPSVPTPVRDLTVYSKNKNSISLRWEPPNPPTGILSSYMIEYYSKMKEIFVKNASCKLWPKLHCATLLNLQENQFYKIQVFARNNIPANLGSPNSVNATTKTEPSEAPYDLHFFWSKANELVLNWKHPNRSNGDILYFNISLIPKSKIGKVEKQIFVDENTYSSTYHYKIDAKELAPSTSYKIIITAYNGHFGEELVANDTSPPDIPSLHSNPQINSTNRTITVQLSVKQPKGLHNYSLLLLVSDHNNQTLKFPEIDNFEIQNYTVASRCNVTNFDQMILIPIGDENQMKNCDQTIQNPALNPGTSYNITVLVANTFQNKTRYKIFSHNIYTRGKPIVPEENSSKLLYLLALLIILPLAVCIYVLRRKFGEARKSKKTTEIPLATSSNRRSENRVTMSKAFSKAVQLGNFQKYMEQCEANTELEQQHSMVLNYPNASIYETTDGGLFFDQIDMEYTDGTKIPKAYIAAGMPKTSFIDDFWKILWEENVQTAILISDLQMRKYWPEKDEKKTCHDITVQLAFAKNLDHYTCRKFILVRHEQIKQVEQIHFQYCGFNPQKFVPLFSKMLKLPLDSTSPVLIHSNSLRDTGLILLCDMSLRTAREERVIDILKNLNKLRCHSSGLVDNVEQYKLAHLIIWEYIFGDCDPQSSDYVNF